MAHWLTLVAQGKTKIMEADASSLFCWVSFNPSLAKLPLKSNGGLAKLGLTFLAK